MARRRILGPQEVERVREQYRLGRENSPKNIARRHGISVSALYNYVRGRHKPARSDRAM